MTKSLVSAKGRQISNIAKTSDDGVSPIPPKEGEHEALMWLRELLHHPQLKRASAVTSDVLAVAKLMAEVKGPWAVPAAVGGVVSTLQKHIGPSASPRAAFIKELLDAGAGVSGGHTNTADDWTKDTLVGLLHNSGMFMSLPLKVYDLVQMFPVHSLNGNYDSVYVLDLPHGRVVGCLDSDNHDTPYTRWWSTLIEGATVDNLRQDMVDILFSTRSAEVIKVHSNDNPSSFGLKAINTEAVDYVVDQHDPVDFANEVEIYRQAGISDGVVLEGPPGSGKCLGRGTPVMKFDGSIVPVESIRNGDILMGPDSKPRLVQGVTQGTGPLFEVSPIRGTPFVCNDVHVLTLKSCDTGRVVDVPLNEFLQKSSNFQMRHKLFKVGVDFSPRDKSPVDPYFLGVWFGDGTKAVGPHGLLGVHITKPDKEVADVCAEVAADWGMTVTTTDTEDKCVSYRLVAGGRGHSGGNPLTDVMRQVIGPNLDIPSFVKFGNRETRLSFLAGFLDTDGYLSKGCFEIVQRRSDWADDIMFIARSLGLFVSRSVKTVNGDDYVRLIISGHTAFIPTRIARKKAQPRKQVKDVLNMGFSVTPIGEGEYFGFTLDGDGRFLLGDFTVTHNTSFVFSYAELTRRSVLMFGASAVNSLSAGDLESLVVAFRPDVLLLDDFEYIHDDSSASFFTSLPDIRKKFPRMLLAMTCNNVEEIEDAITRPGRGGRILPTFAAPGPEARERVLRFYLDKYLTTDQRMWFKDVVEVVADDGTVTKETRLREVFNSHELAEAMCEYFTQDWIRSIAERCVIHWRVLLSGKGRTRSESVHPMNLVLDDIRRTNAILIKKVKNKEKKTAGASAEPTEAPSVIGEEDATEQPKASRALARRAVGLVRARSVGAGYAGDGDKCVPDDGG